MRGKNCPQWGPHGEKMNDESKVMKLVPCDTDSEGTYVPSDEETREELVGGIEAPVGGILD